MRANGNIVDPYLAQDYLAKGHYDEATLQMIEDTKARMWGELTKGKSPLQPGQIRILEQITGVAGAGKSMHVLELMKDDYHATHSIVIDPDALRKLNGFFDATIEAEMEGGASYEDADNEAMWRWQPANIYLMLELMNMVSHNNFSMIRTGRPSGTVTDSVMLHAADAGFKLNTTILHAPLEICEAAAAIRLQAGGHPVPKEKQVDGHVKFAGRLVDLFRYSDSVQLRWRDQPDQPSRVVAEMKSGDLHAIDQVGLDSLMATFGRANTENNLAYFAKLHRDHLSEAGLLPGRSFI